MAMRDSKGKFMKRVKQALSSSTPSTLELEYSNPDFPSSAPAVNVVPAKTNVQKSTNQRRTTVSATVTVIGNLTADPDLRTTNNGKSVCNFALAYTPRKPDGSDGNTSFYNIAVWEYLADNFAASFKKGDRLIVTGRLSQDKWMDKDTEKMQSRLSITADEIGGTCKFHTVEMQRVQRKAEAAPVVEGENVESEDIFA